MAWCDVEGTRSPSLPHFFLLYYVRDSYWIGLDWIEAKMKPHTYQVCVSLSIHTNYFRINTIMLLLIIVVMRVSKFERELMTTTVPCRRLRLGGLGALRLRSRRHCRRGREHLVR